MQRAIRVLSLRAECIKAWLDGSPLFNEDCHNTDGVLKPEYEAELEELKLAIKILTP